MNRVLLVYIISIIGFIYGMRVPAQDNYRNYKTSISLDSPNERLLKGYVYGKMEYLTRLQKNEHNRLVIGHLVTPSGFHLATLLFFIRPLFRLLRNRKSTWKDLLEIAVLSFSFLLPELYAIKRMAVFRIIMLINQKLNKPRHVFEVFLVTFFFDYLFFNFKYSPSSYWYSFLFFGVILANIDRGFKSAVIPILGAQVICHFVEGTAFNLVASFFGIIFTQCFIIIFPILILSFFLWKSTHNIFFLIPSEFTEKTISFFAKLSHHTSDIMIGPLSIFLIILVSYRYKKHTYIPIFIFIFSCLFYPLDCLNSRIKDFTSPIKGLGIIPPNIRPVQSYRYREGIRTIYSNGLNCYEKLHGNVWNRKCKGFLDS